MSGLETAIRNALERSDRSSAEIRARIYQSARHALETGLRKQDISDPEVVALQRERLERVIHGIEEEERARQAPSGEELAVVDVRPVPEVRANAAEPERRPVIDEVVGETRGAPPGREKPGGDLSGLQVERGDRLAEAPAADRKQAATATASASPPDVRPERVARRRGAGLLAALFIYGMLLAALGGTAWWVLNSGLVDEFQRFWQEASSENGEVRPQPENGQQFSGVQTLDPQSGFSDDWIEIFKPGDVGKLKANGKSSAEAVSDGPGPSVRITSSGVGEEGSVSLEIPASVLQALAGKRSTIALTLQSASQSPTQVVVECAFASLGNCGRHRFTVTEQQSDILFQVVFDRSLAPTTPGVLEISSDLEGRGRGVYLSAARILPGQ